MKRLFWAVIASILLLGGLSFYPEPAPVKPVQPIGHIGPDGFRRDLFRGVLPFAPAVAQASQVVTAGPIGPTGGGDTFTGGSISSATAVSNDICLTIGTTDTSASPCIRYDTTQTVDAGMLLTGTVGNAWVIAERQDETFDFAHAQATDPTLFIHSHNQTTTEWFSARHDGSYARLSVGAGSFFFNSAVLLDTGYNLTLAGSGGLVLGSGIGGLYNNTVQTPDTVMLTTGTLANSLILAEEGDKAFDFAHAQATNPTLFIHSAAQSTTQYGSMYHDGTNFLFDAGAGGVRIVPTLLLDSYLSAIGAAEGATVILPKATAQTPDTGMLLTGTTANSWIFAEYGDSGFDFAHAQATNPTLFIHSAAQSTTEFVGLSHTGRGSAQNNQDTVALTEAGGAEQFLTITTATTQNTGGAVNYTIKIEDSAGSPDYTVRSGSFNFAMTNSAGTTTCGVGGHTTETNTALAQGGTAKTLTFTIAGANAANVCNFTVDINSDMVTATSASISYSVILNGPGSIS